VNTHSHTQLHLHPFSVSALTGGRQSTARPSRLRLRGNRRLAEPQFLSWCFGLKKNPPSGAEPRFPCLPALTVVCIRFLNTLLGVVMYFVTGTRMSRETGVRTHTCLVCVRTAFLLSIKNDVINTIGRFHSPLFEHHNIVGLFAGQLAMKSFLENLCHTVPNKEFFFFESHEFRTFLFSYT
jgi:hypothetical protein